MRFATLVYFDQRVYKRYLTISNDKRLQTITLPPPAAQLMNQLQQLKTVVKKLSVPSLPLSVIGHKREFVTNI